LLAVPDAERVQAAEASGPADPYAVWQGVVAQRRNLLSLARLSLVLQDCRGTASYFHEADDGEATVWFEGRLGLQGMSYMGFTAWATASRCKDDVAAISVSYYSSDRIRWYLVPDGGLASTPSDQALSDEVHLRSDRPDSFGGIDELRRRACPAVQQTGHLRSGPTLSISPATPPRNR
jgi:hypothetical protein